MSHADIEKTNEIGINLPFCIFQDGMGLPFSSVGKVGIDLSPTAHLVLCMDFHIAK
jgi:hypothetical protein